MRCSNGVWCAVTIGILTMAAGGLPAGESVAQTASTDTVTISQASYQEILNRLTSLEAVTGAMESEPADGGLKELDLATKPTQKWTGRIHFDHWAFPGNDAGTSFFENGDPTSYPGDRILFRRLRLGMKGKLLETMEYKLEFDFGKGTTQVIKDAYIGWNELPFLHTVLIGNQKRPYGLDHLNSSRYNVFMERPFMVEALSPDARRVGLCSYGVSEDEAYNWRFGAFIPDDMQTTGEYIVADEPGKHAYQAEFSGRFANTIWYDETSGGRGYAHWAVSGAYVDTDGTAGANNVARFSTRPEARTSSRWIDTGRIVGAENYGLLGLEGVINVGPVQWVGEYMSTWVERDGGQPDTQFHGGYTYLSYFLTGEHVPWKRYAGVIDRVHPFENFFLVNRCNGETGSGWGAWQVALRYSHGDFTDENVYGGVGDSWTFGLNWWWTPHSRLQFNCIHGTIDDRGDPASGDPRDGTYTILGTRFAADF